MKKWTFFVGLLLSSQTINAQLVINELMQSNIDCIMDDLNEFPDSWVELYNTAPSHQAGHLMIFNQKCSLRPHPCERKLFLNQ